MAHITETVTVPVSGYSISLKTFLGQPACNRCICSSYGFLSVMHDAAFGTQYFSQTSHGLNSFIACSHPFLSPSLFIFGFSLSKYLLLFLTLLILEHPVSPSATFLPHLQLLHFPAYPSRHFYLPVNLSIPQQSTLNDLYLLFTSII